MRNISSKKSILKKNILIIAVSLLALCLGACAMKPGPSGNNNQGTEFYMSAPGNYDSADTAIVISKDVANSTVTFMTLSIYKKYTLNFDGATTFYDKYGQALSFAQISEGDIVNLNFMKSSKRLNSLQLSSDAFVLSGLEDYELGSRKMMIGKEEYAVSGDVVIIGPSGQAELMDINDVDVLTVQGFGHTINSIVIDRSHGYLRLENDSFFVGGFIEVDNDKVYQIQDEMLLAIPSGDIEVTVSHLGCIGTERLSVEAGKEYSIDVSGWQGEAKKGSIVFIVSPDDAKVLIDGKQVDISAPVELEYGIHQMNISAKGYKTISKYLKVGSSSANIDVTLEKENAKQETSVSTNSTVSDNHIITPPPSVPSVSENIITSPTVSGNTIPSASGNQIPESSTVSNNTAADNSSDIISTDERARVYIDGPADVEVYVDGTYIGVAPTSFKKKEGFAVVTLRKEGYSTRSYTLELDNISADEHYSFAELTQL